MRTAAKEQSRLLEPPAPPTAPAPAPAPAARPLPERRFSASRDSLQLRRREWVYTAMAAEGDVEESPARTRAFFALKTLQLALAIINLGLIIDPFRFMRETDELHAGAVFVAFASVIIVNCVLLISRATGEPTPLRAALLFTFVNGALLVAAGGVVLADWAHMYYRIHNLQPKLYLDMMIASGVIAIFNAAAHFVEIGLTVTFS